MSEDLQRYVPETSGQIIEMGITDAFIAELQKKYAVVSVPSNTAEHKELSASWSEVRGYRLNVEKRRKELKEDALKFGKAVDFEAKRVTAPIEEVEERLYAARKAYEDEKERIKKEKEAAEKARIDAIQARIAEIAAYPLMLSGMSAEVMRGEAGGLGGLAQFDFAEFEERANAEISLAQDRCAEMIVAREKYEADIAAEAQRKAENDAKEELLRQQQEEFERRKKEFEDRQREAARVEKERQEEQEEITRAKVKAAEMSDVTKEKVVMMTVRKAEYEKLKLDSRLLECLFAAGVDNWEGYDDANEAFLEGK